MKNLPAIIKRLAPALACTLIALSAITIVAVTASNPDSETVTTTHKHTVKFDSHAADLEQDGDTVMSAFDMQAIAGKVEWNDNDNAANTRPDSVTVELRIPNVWDPVKTVQTAAADDWRYSFGSMPAVSNDGNKIEYSITIAPIDGYASEYNGYDIKNTNIPGKNAVAINIKWDDDSDRDGLRPDEVTIELDRCDDDNLDTDANKQKIVLNEANHWSYTFTDVDTIAGASKDRKWLVGELVDWRTKNEYAFHDDDDSWTVDASRGNQTVNIRNAHRIYTTSVDIKNVWEGDDSGEKIRPEKVIAKLATELGPREIEIVADDPSEGLHDWTGHYEGPRYCNGKEVDYKILGVRVDDASQSKYDSRYEAEIDDNAEISYNQYYDEEQNGIFDINNVYEPADRYVNEYLSVSDDVIPGYTQVWYEGDEAAKLRSTVSDSALGLKPEDEGEFQQWELDHSRDIEDTVKDLAGNQIPITVHVNTYRPVVYQKFWAVGTNSSNGKLTLFIDACEAPSDIGNSYKASNGITYNKLSHVGDYGDVDSIGTAKNGDTPQSAPAYYDEMDDNDKDWQILISNKRGWQTVLGNNICEQIQTFTICNNIKEKIRVTSLAGWFSGFTNITDIDLSKIDTSNCINMAALFRHCESLQTSGIKGLSQLDTSKVVTMYGMFLGAGVGNDIFDVLNSMPMDSLKDIQNMFSDAPNVTSAELAFKAGKLENVGFLFSKPSSTANFPDEDGNGVHDVNEALKTVTIGMRFDNVKIAGGMFGLNQELKTVNTNGVAFTMPNARKIDNMFQHCFVLTSVSGFTDCSKGAFEAGLNGLTMTRNIFEQCYNLKTLYFQGIHFNNIKDETGPDEPYIHMLGGCTGATVYINPTYANQVLKDSGMTVQNYLQSMLPNNTVKLSPNDLLNTMGSFSSKQNNVTLPFAYTNYAKSGFVVRHAGEAADKGQGRTLGDKKLTLTIHHRIKKIEGAPNKAQASTVMPPVQQIASEPDMPANKPIGGLGDNLFAMLIAGFALVDAAAIGYVVYRRRKNKR